MKVIAATLLMLVAASQAQQTTDVKYGDSNGLASEILKTAVRKLTRGVTKDTVRSFDSAKCAECIANSGDDYDKACADTCKNVVRRTKNEYISSKNPLYDRYRTKDCLNCVVRNNRVLEPPDADNDAPSAVDHHCSVSCCYYNCSRKCRTKDLDRILAKLVTKEKDEYLKTEFDFSTGSTNENRRYAIFGQVRP